MSKRLYREFYLLPRGEQRALILLSLLLILSLLFRITVQLLPEKELKGMEEFVQEASMIRAAYTKADSLQQLRRDSIARNRAGSSRYGSSYSSSRIMADSYPERQRNSTLPIDINRADSATLLPLPGIGPVYAGRIVKYRNLLGGYVSLNQLTEVYGISPETLEMITDRIVMDTTSIIKLDLNRATFRELLRHPYLEYEDVKDLVNYRDYKGTIQSILELRENYILPDSVLQKVEPYFNYSISEAVDLSK